MALEEWERFDTYREWLEYEEKERSWKRRMAIYDTKCANDAVQEALIRGPQLIRSAPKSAVYLQSEFDIAKGNGNTSFIAYPACHEMETEWGYTLVLDQYRVEDNLTVVHDKGSPFGDRYYINDFRYVNVCGLQFLVDTTGAWGAVKEAAEVVSWVTGYAISCNRDNDNLPEGIYNPPAAHGGHRKYYCHREAVVKGDKFACVVCGRRRLSRKYGGDNRVCSFECREKEGESWWERERRIRYEEKAELKCVRQVRSLLSKTKKALRENRQDALPSLKTEFEQLRTSRQ